MSARWSGQQTCVPKARRSSAKTASETVLSRCWVRSHLAIVPFVLIMITSFVKIAVVLSIVRQAIGTQQIPPTQVITGLAIVLTVYIMMPVGLDIYHNAEDRILKQTGKALDIKQLNFDQVADLATDAQEPIRNLMKHAHLKDRDMFYKLAWRMRQPRDRATLADDNWTVIVPAFVISELKEASRLASFYSSHFLLLTWWSRIFSWHSECRCCLQRPSLAVQDFTLRACRWLVSYHPRPCDGLFLTGGRNGRANSRFCNSVHQ